MPQFFYNKRLMIILATIILFVVLLGYSLNSNRKLSFPEKIVKDSVSLTEKIFNKPAQYIAGLFDNMSDLQNTYKENKQLKAKLDRYVELSVKEKEYEKENKDLRDLLNIKSSMQAYNPIEATVIVRDPDNWQQMVTIDKGESAGIQNDMAVRTAKGLIGKVKHVSKFTSTVQLLSASDRTNRISAKIQQSKDNIYGLIEGYDVDSQMLLLKRIPSNAKVTKGQVVVTSGLGGVFPDGLPIGTVTKVERDEYGLTQTAYVKPLADFDDINHVIVAKSTIHDLKSGEGK
jgi:rod shape-determining protein MreC